MLTLASYLEERAAKLKREALGRCQVAFAGSPPNCFSQLLVTFFGYKGDLSELGSTAGEDTEEESDLLAAFRKVVQKSPAAATVPEQPSATTSIPAYVAKASSMESIRPQATPAMTRAIIFRPGRDEKQWSRTGLTQEYHPHHDGGKYTCPLCPPSQYEPKGNMDTVATHIQRNHLNHSIGCHFCYESFFSCEGWKKHTANKHGKTKEEFVPPEANYELEVGLDDETELEVVKEEEAEAIERAVRLSGQNLSAEPEFHEEEVTEEEDIMEVTN